MDINQKLILAYLFIGLVGTIIYLWVIHHKE